ncbi:MAG: transcriptional repressor [Patescibacteria group bacterium]|nr:transcriptional repressor [Patescibacteria group bacterium]
MDLKGTKYRLTKQRQIILEEICKVCCHPTAEDVFKLVRKRLPDIGVATVYRNLDFLEKNGYIIRLKSLCGCSGKARYDGNCNGHIHLICTCCGEVCDIFDCKKFNIKSKELEKSGFNPDLNHLEIPGLCKKCNKTKK